MRFILTKFKKNRTLILILLFLLCLYFLIIIFNYFNDLEETNEIISCNNSQETLFQIKELSLSIKEIFDSLQLKYFLCYETLWGVLKFKKPLPWHSNIEFCVLNDQLFNQDEQYILRHFRRNKLSVKYSTKYGFYKVNYQSNDVYAKIFVFEKDSVTQSYRRIGWKYRLIPPNECSLINCFPEHLIENNLPTNLFLDETFNVPHEGEEILKYLYPDNWWKYDIPDKCKNI